MISCARLPGWTTTTSECRRRGSSGWCRSLRVALREIVYRMDAFQRLIDQGFWGLKLLLVVVVRGAEYPLSKGLPTTGVAVPALIAQLVA